jgi:roadblock/LC7 domain-containing protein
MGDFDKLMGLPGAIAAFQFTDRGELTEHRVAEGSGLDEKILDLLSHVCVANMSIATMQARGWESLTGMGGFYPIDGFTLIGVDWSAVVNGSTGVVLRNQEADYQAAYDALS